MTMPTTLPPGLRLPMMSQGAPGSGSVSWPQPPLPEVLTQGTFNIAGRDGEQHEFHIYADEGVRHDSKVLVILPGAGGFTKRTHYPVGKAPKPCWTVVLDVEGKFKKRTPTYLEALLRYLKGVININSDVVIIGFSRGAAWVVDVALENADLFDAAIALAPYPWTKQPTDNMHEARMLMQVQKPIMLLHFVSDEHCNAMKYPEWYSQFALAMEAEPGSSFGLRQPGFLSYMLEGRHIKGYDMLVSLDFHAANPCPDEWWRNMWSQ